MSHSHRRSKRICLVPKKPLNLTHPEYRQITCYHSWCCNDGCCAWYINFSVVFIIVIICIVIWKLIDSCWHKYCRDMAETTINNESQENMLMMSLDSACTSRDTLQNYGSSQVTHLDINKEEEDEKPPSYEEAIAMN